MFRFLLRACGTVLLAAGVAALLADGARSVEASRLLVTSVDEWVATLGWALAPPQAGSVGGAVLALGWTAATRLVPLWAALAGVGALLLVAGRRRAEGIGSARR